MAANASLICVSDATSPPPAPCSVRYPPCLPTAPLPPLLRLLSIPSWLASTTPSARRTSVSVLRTARTTSGDSVTLSAAICAASPDREPADPARDALRATSSAPLPLPRATSAAARTTRRPATVLSLSPPLPLPRSLPHPRAERTAAVTSSGLRTLDPDIDTDPDPDAEREPCVGPGVGAGAGGTTGARKEMGARECVFSGCVSEEESEEPSVDARGGGAGGEYGLPPSVDSPRIRERDAANIVRDGEDIKSPQAHAIPNKCPHCSSDFISVHGGLHADSRLWCQTFVPNNGLQPQTCVNALTDALTNSSITCRVHWGV